MNCLLIMLALNNSCGILWPPCKKHAVAVQTPRYLHYYYSTTQGILVKTIFKKTILLVFLAILSNSTIIADAILWNRTGGIVTVNGHTIKNHTSTTIAENFATIINYDYYGNGDLFTFRFEANSFNDGCEYQLYGTISRGKHIAHDKELVDYLIESTEGCCSLLFSNQFFAKSNYSLLFLFCVETTNPTNLIRSLNYLRLNTTFNLADWSETHVELLSDTDAGMIFLSQSPCEENVLIRSERINKKGKLVIEEKKEKQLNTKTTILQFDYVEHTDESLSCPLAIAIMRWFKDNSIRLFSYKKDFVHNLPIEPILFNLSLATLREVKYYNIYGMHDETLTLAEAHGVYFKWQLPGALYKIENSCECSTHIGYRGKRGYFEIGMTFGATGAYTRNTLAINHFLFIPDETAPEVCLHSENFADLRPEILPADELLEGRTVFSKTPRKPSAYASDTKATPERDNKCREKMTRLENSVVKNFSSSITKTPLNQATPERNTTKKPWLANNREDGEDDDAFYLFFNSATSLNLHGSPAANPADNSQKDVDHSFQLYGTNLFEADCEEEYYEAHDDDASSLLQYRDNDTSYCDDEADSKSDNETNEYK